MGRLSLVDLCTEAVFKNEHLYGLLHNSEQKSLPIDVLEILNKSIQDCKTCIENFKITVKESPNLTYFLIKNYPEFQTPNILTIAIVNAARNGNLELVKYLIEERHLDVDARTNLGETILHLAALSGNLELVKYLIE